MIWGGFFDKVFVQPFFMKLYLPIILGTARMGRESEKAARFVLSEVKSRPEIETELVDVRDFRLPATDDSEEPEIAKRWGDKAERADGFIIVSPEYNHGYSGELKMFLDMIHDQYARKPVAICGVSSGSIGGARMVEQLRLVLIDFRMVPVGTAVYFFKIGALFKDGQITDESYKTRLGKMLDELVWFAEALKIAREKPVPIDKMSG